MKCFCCGKPLPKDRESTGWHKACVRRFFGTDVIPVIEIDNKTLEMLANESTSKGYTVPGVQKKLSLHLFSDKANPRLTLVNYPTGYILKPQVDEFEALPEAEHMVMSMADKAGIATVPNALIRCKDNYAYITKRVDRMIDNNKVDKLAMEDFCQLDRRLTQDKYRGSYERCVKVINQYSSRKGLDLTELYLRLVFSFVVGNSDMHLKNFSLIETVPGSGQYQLSPAYDLLPVNVVMPEDKEQFALPMNGKKQNIRRKDFLIFADACKISRKTAEKLISRIIMLKEEFTKMCEESLIPDYMKSDFVNLMKERASILE